MVDNTFLIGQSKEDGTVSCLESTVCPDSDLRSSGGRAAQLWLSHSVVTVFAKGQKSSHHRNDCPGRFKRLHPTFPLGLFGRLVPRSVRMCNLEVGIVSCAREESFRLCNDFCKFKQRSPGAKTAPTGWPAKVRFGNIR